MTTWRPPPLLHTPAVVTLTARQAQILTGLCEGLTDAAIGRRLYVTEDTVKTHAKRLRRTLGATDRTHAVALACSGWVRVEVVER